MSPARELLMLGMPRRSPSSAYDINVAIKNHSPFTQSSLATATVGTTILKCAENAL